LVIVIVALAAVYGFWRVRYGTPPREWPQVLCFHKISQDFCWEGTWTTPRRFFQYVDRLRALGHRFIDMDEYLEWVGTRSGPGQGADPGGGVGAGANASGRVPLLLTFDDGYRELYDVVLPGLEGRGVPFHVFLVTDYVGRDNTWDLSLGRRPFRHLGWPQIEEMAERGVTFGSHGATHRDLTTTIDPDDVRAELASSKEAIEEHLGRPVRTVSYPFGRCDDVAVAAARGAGYEAAFSLYPPHHNLRFDRYAIRRNGVYVIDPVVFADAKVTPGPLFWMEEMKCRAINAVAVLTPLLKRLSGQRPQGRDS
jgi:peptidoglycan/xylan/chitin deacetylase (PgdA/CDA1 family)